MFKKTKVREILEFLNKGLSAREIAEVLNVSRNTISYIKNIFDKCDKDFDEILLMDDDEMYAYFYPRTFTPRNRFAPVDYSYVHKELKKTGVTQTLLWEEYCKECDEKGLKHCCFTTFTTGYKRYVSNNNYTSHVEHKPGIILEVDWSGPTMHYIDPDTDTNVTVYLFVATFPYSQYTYIEGTTAMDQNSWLSCHVNMFEYFGGTPVRIVCDNLKTGVISHPRHGEVILNDAYLSLAEYYQIAILPAGVKKPKHKPSAEGSVGKIARKIIGMLRNDTFYSLEALNYTIKEKLDELNSRPFQKRESNRKTIFKLEELPKLRKLPALPYEVCSWSYEHIVYPDSHIVFNKGRYSVPCEYIGKSIDIKYNSSQVFIYYSHKPIASHLIIPSWNTNGKRTNSKHLPRPLYTPDTLDTILEKANNVGPCLVVVIERLFNDAKVKDQAILDAKSILHITNSYGKENLEKACKLALKDYHKITYNTLIPYLKNVAKANHQNQIKHEEHTGNVRGAEYYKKKVEK